MNFECLPHFHPEATSNNSIFAETVPGYGIPSELHIIGSGSAKEYCGKVKSVGACSKKHVPSETVVRHWCKDRLCPICYPIWAAKSGERAKERIMGYSDLNDQMIGSSQQDLNGDSISGIPGFVHPGKTKHFTFSPPQEWAIEKMKTASGVRSLRRELYRVLSIAGIGAAACVIHPWRATTQARREYRNKKRKGGQSTNHGLWHWLIRTGRYQFSCYVYLSPHFHVIGIGYAMRSDEFYQVTKVKKREGWIYKNIRTLYSEDDVSNVLFYVLGHTAVIYDHKTGGSLNSITYYGDISYHSMGHNLVHREYLNVECPDCCGNVNEWVGWVQERKHDDEYKEERWCWSWNSADSELKPLMTYDLMRYHIEKHRYWMKGLDEYESIQVRGGGDPVRKLISGKREMICSESDGQAYDWVSGQWITCEDM